MSRCLEGMNVVFLCGGLGKRLRPAVSDKPKVLADINGKPFVGILIDNLSRFGIKDIILSIGYKKESIRDYFQKRCAPGGYSIVFSEEENPLGTGGALKKAKPLVKSSSFLVLNGDSFCAIDYEKFLNFHQKKKALVSIAIVKTQGYEDAGSVTLNDKDVIVDFNEKGAVANGYINAGVYIFNKQAFSLMPEKCSFSLEYDFFPKLAGKSLYGYVSESRFIDIGTPQRYEKAKRFFCEGGRP
ncbi:MAG: nucleotidyltransferase family protein [Candidatus Omnitrophota bacterium]